MWHTVLHFANMKKEHVLKMRARGIIVHDNTLLVVQHSKEVPHFCLPGGHAEWGEDPRTCLERELVEELGVKPTIGKLLYVHSFMQNNYTQIVEFLFEVLNADAYTGPRDNHASHAHEIADVRWLAPDNTDYMVLPEIVRYALKDGTLLTAPEPRFINYL